MKKLTIKGTQEFAKQRNGKCLSNKYIDCITPLKWKCNIDSHEWMARFNDIKRGHWCPKCANQNKTTLLDAQNLIKSRNGMMLTSKYKNNRTPIKIKCNKDGYEWLSTYHTIKSGAWCPKCANQIKHTIEDCRKIA